MRRFVWRDHILGLDSEHDYEEIYRILTAHEFPWDMMQALSLALFRTYAVPSIGELLAETREFTERTQKRYDDTALLLGIVTEQGFDTETGRAAIRRINQMHRPYRIPNDEMRYVLTTFVAVPLRWIEAYGWRPLTETEKAAITNYYRRLGRMMNIRDIPDTYQEFVATMDAYEAKQFGYNPGGRAVADATLSLLATLPPQHLLPAGIVQAIARAVLDDPLLDALGYPQPPRPVRAMVNGALRARARLVRWLPARAEPQTLDDLLALRTYPDGYKVDQLGTFPSTGCPVGRATSSAPARRRPNPASSQGQ